MTQQPHFVRYMGGTNKRSLSHDLTAAFRSVYKKTNKRLLSHKLTAAFRSLYKRNR